MSTEKNVGVARSGHEEFPERGTPAVTDEVFIPDYVMQDFGLLSDESGKIPKRSHAAGREAGGETA